MSAPSGWKLYEQGGCRSVRGLNPHPFNTRNNSDKFCHIPVMLVDAGHYTVHVMLTDRM